MRQIWIRSRICSANECCYSWWLHCIRLSRQNSLSEWKVGNIKFLFQAWTFTVLCALTLLCLAVWFFCLRKRLKLQKCLKDHCEVNNMSWLFCKGKYKFCSVWLFTMPTTISSLVWEEQAAAWPLSPVFSTGSIQNQKQGTHIANMLN